MILSVLIFFLTPAAHAGSFRYADLERLLQDSTRTITTVDDLLAQPELTPSFRAGVTAVFRSRSIQYADPLNPRILMYGEDARLILAFTCDPTECGNGKKPGLDSLELVHYVDAEKRFEFRSIRFAPGQKPVLSEANPRKCMGCHEGSDPRPNWESYPVWPGVYGGNDDGLSGALIDGEDPNSLQAFLAAAPGRLRYRRIADLAEGYTIREERHANQHNIKLTQAITNLNVPRIVDRMRKSPYYETVKYGLALALAQQQPIPEQVESAGFEDTFDLWKQCLRPTVPDGELVHFPSETAETIRAFYALGSESLPWFTGFLPVLRREITGPESDIDTDMLNELRRLDPELREMLPPDSFRKKAAAGWAALHDVTRAGLEKCADEASHPRSRRSR